MSDTTIKKLEIFLLGLLGFSIFTSKAGINISVTILLMLFLYSLISNSAFREKALSSPVTKISLIAYLIAVVSCLISPGNLDDIVHIARKSLFLVVFPYLIILFNNKKHKQSAIIGLLLGLLLSIFYGLYTLLQMKTTGLNPLRLESFLDVGRWSENLSYFLAFSIPFWFNLTNDKFKYALMTVIILSIVCLVLTGSRGPWLATFIVVNLLLLSCYKQFFLKIFLVCLISLPILTTVFPTKFEGVTNRVESILDTKVDQSNTARLIMWKKAIAFTSYNWSESPTKVIFGLGENNYTKEFKIYISKTSPNVTNETAYFSFTEPHNAYLESLVKHGLLYELTFLSLLIYITFMLIRCKHQYKQAGICVISSFLIIGIFYSNQMVIQTYTVFFMLALCLPMLKEGKNIDQTSELKTGLKI
ncbi:O-antigen ligase family protein [Photobacterium alginatilyticum]|uniref:O-antigen ligase family protein n=1 Tax=Photobacterium alginatilyticum TaxID=1775171 RepID=A0ABW9YJ29_9GAMM|nr:O-antigen ligase family protein [Photobacterium alginatilyticum]NBI53760.1 O-antigen ligase family protein [Photobacterium alginatilyticum]